ncbi:MAG: ABC-2 family transporter protein [bacterium]|nr:ABC-2 family transporter protein [bacterium]
MKKVSLQIRFYSKVIRFKFIKALQWRTEMVLWILLDVFPFIILLFIWKSVLSVSENQAILFSDLTVFYFLVIVIQGFTSTHFEEYRPKEIRMGKIDFFLIKPYNYIQDIVLNDLAGKLLYILMLSPLLIILGTVLWQQGLIVLPDLTIVHLAAFILLMFFAYCMQMLFSLCISLLSFWFEEANGLLHVKWFIVAIFSGTLIPLPLMPEWLLQATNAQPLKFLFAVPIQLVQKGVLPTFEDWGLLLGTIMFLILCSKLLWNKGIQKYSSAGG